jgi:UBX domain-containing protein 1
LNGEEELDDKTNTNFFTGGEKSALQVEDPNKKDGNQQKSIIDQIFQRAQEQMGEPDDRPSATEEYEEPKFVGTGFKLGDGTEPSETIADPSSSRPQRLPKVNREITFWKQGFTVGDGPLHRYDDPANEQVLQELNRGRVPVSLLDVEFGQDVDVSVLKKNDEDYKPAKRKAGGYHGHGQRLGSPVPGELKPRETATEPAATTTTEPQPEDNGHGDTLVQIRFANGKKVSHKFNSSDSILIVYDFVRQHEFNDQDRPFNLSHAFPVKPIEESQETTVADAKLKNAVIVQRWK